MSGSEQRFLAASRSFDFAGRDLQPVMDRMQAWRQRLVQTLDDKRLEASGLQASSDLARRVRAMDEFMQSGARRWADAWAAQQPAQSLAEAFEDKAMLLIFGKFNAGKSSLCNFLAERFRLHGHQVRFFRLDAGQIVDAPQCFPEGATETTACLQGVCLGERLVLLDTPGLHSETGENAALTQQFLDSADAVCWLTSSTSPGQVQELNELARELRRHKPLLPIITRSDRIEEDEVDGAIVKLLCNKTQANRALQEADVLQRATDKLHEMQLDASVLKAPVSLSVHVARSQEQTDAAMNEAGFERLYAALLELAAPALAYKQRKPAEVLMHHLQEVVLGDLKETTLPALAELRAALRTGIAELQLRQTQMLRAAWREVVPELPRILEEHAPRRDTRAACAEVEQRALDAFERHQREQLGDYQLPTPERINMSAAAGEGYEASETGVGEPDGAPVGYERFHAALMKAVQEQLAERSARAVEACAASLERLDAQAASLQEQVQSHERKLRHIQDAMRSGKVA